MNPVLLLPFLLTALTNLHNDFDMDVRVSVLALLEPRAISIRCYPEARLSLAGSDGDPQTLLPGEELEIVADAGALRLAIAGGRERLELPRAERCRIVGAGADTRFDVEVLEPELFRRRFAGELEVSADGDRLLLVLGVPLERLVGEVAAAEMGDAPDGALAAQAVAARSFVVAMRGRHRDEGFDVCDTTHCLLYRGLDGAFGTGGEDHLERGIRAAQETAGIVLADGGRVVPGYFHACCGGSTATPAMVWGGDLHSHHFIPVACNLCRDSPHSTWRRQATPEDIVRALGHDTAAGPWRLEIIHHPDSPYVAAINLSGPDGEDEFAADRFRLFVGRALGWNVVRSNAYGISLEEGRVVFEGAGFGHGVGLCQEGAKAAARAGWGWRRILRHYFPRCSLRRSNYMSR